jgi:hypothetical protein
MLRPDFAMGKIMVAGWLQTIFQSGHMQNSHQFRITSSSLDHRTKIGVNRLTVGKPLESSSSLCLDIRMATKQDLEFLDFDGDLHISGAPRPAGSLIIDMIMKEVINTTKLVQKEEDVPSGS